jgi:hypothetical protein
MILLALIVLLVLFRKRRTKLKLEIDFYLTPDGLAPRTAGPSSTNITFVG